MASSTQGLGLLTPKRPLERRLSTVHMGNRNVGGAADCRRCHPCRGGHRGEAHGSRRRARAVTSSPAGISCPGRCTATFAAGTTVVLTETSKNGSKFVGWAVLAPGQSRATSS